MLEVLIHRFILARKIKPSNVNELLDFTQKEYVEKKITIVQYRNLLRELTNRGAVKPSYDEEIGYRKEVLL